MAPRIEPQHDASALVPHPHRFTLQGEPAGLRFPPLCAHCGQPASGRIGCTKVFSRSDSDSPTEHVIASVEVPFCAGCIAQHRAQTPARHGFSDVLSSFSTAEMFGAVFPGIAALFVGWLTLKQLWRGQWATATVTLVLALFFGLIAWYQRRHVWRDTAYLRVPPQSPIAQAFDFSDCCAAPFEPARFVCTVRDADFAAAFEALNRQQLWVANSPAAVAARREANRKTWLIGGIVAALALVLLIVDHWR